MKAKLWTAIWLVVAVAVLISAGCTIYKVDPYFHYHLPDTDTYFYKITNSRCQNDGITKHFDYDAMITGSSMTENFKPSELDELFGVHSIKVSFSGATYKEISDNIRVGLQNNPRLKLVVRCLDISYMLDDKDKMLLEPSAYPKYLYDRNPFNDVKYLFNYHAITIAQEMIAQSRQPDFIPGMVSFDDAYSWQSIFSFGRHRIPVNSELSVGEPQHLSNKERETIRANIEQNVLTVAQDYPDVDFYCFFPPYSLAWWTKSYADGSIYKLFEAEQLVVELLLPCENLRLFSFGNRFDITTDLNNYKDTNHYAAWINSLILKWMHDGEGLLTSDNYLEYLERELSFYLAFDYSSFAEQPDYENDYYAEALLRQELTGIAPRRISLEDAVFSGDSRLEDGKILCSSDSSGALGKAELLLDNVDTYKYISFYGKKLNGDSAATIEAVDSNGKYIADIYFPYEYIRFGEQHLFLLDISGAEGAVTLELVGVSPDSVDASFMFSDFYLY